MLIHSDLKHVIRRSAAGCSLFAFLFAAALLPPNVRADPAADSGERTRGDAGEKAEEKAGVSTRDWAPLTKRSAPFLVTVGQGKGEHVMQRVAPMELDRDQEHWEMKLGDRRTTWVKRGEDGRLAIVNQVLRDENAQVFFDPAATLLPARAVEGQTIKEEGKVRIFGLDGDKRTEGTYKQNVEYVGRVKVRTPAGVFTGHRVRILQRLDTSLADVRVTMDMVFAPGTGRVYQNLTKNTEKLGFLESTNVEEIKRAASE